MKKFIAIGFLLLVGCTFICCGNDDNDEKPQSVDYESLLTSYVWSSNKARVTFCKNHLVYYEGTAAMASGALTGGASIYVGSWNLSGNTLTTTFTAGSYEVINSDGIFYGTLYIEEYLENKWLELKTTRDVSLSLTRGQARTDNGDTSACDKGILGTWAASVYYSPTNDATPQQCALRMTFLSNGNVRTTLTGNGVNRDETAPYKTSYGNITFDKFLTIAEQKESFYYMVDDHQLYLYTPEGLINSWTFTKAE